MKTIQNTDTDSGELHAFHRGQTKNEAELNRKMSLPPLELGEGTHTASELDAFHRRQAEHHESLKQGNAMRAADFVTHGPAQPEGDRTLHQESKIPTSQPKPSKDAAILYDAKSSGQTKHRPSKSDPTPKQNEGGNAMPYLGGR